MQFKLDENLPASLVRDFAAADHDAVTAVAQGLQGASDSHFARICREEARALVTLDVGFADTRAYPPGEHAGIVVLRLKRQSVPSARLAVRRLLRLVGEQPLDGQLWIVEGDKVRCRV